MKAKTIQELLRHASRLHREFRSRREKRAIDALPKQVSIRQCYCSTCGHVVMINRKSQAGDHGDGRMHIVKSKYGRGRCPGVGRTTLTAQQWADLQEQRTKIVVLNDV